MSNRFVSEVLNNRVYRRTLPVLAGISLLALGLFLFVGVRDSQGIGVVTATKVDTFAPGGDVDNDGKADPGDTLRYTVTITNGSGADITGANFADTIDANTTLVPGSLHVSTIARNDAYNATGNTQISVPAPGVLGNDSDPDGGSLTASGSGSSTQGGTQRQRRRQLHLHPGGRIHRHRHIHLHGHGRYG